MAFAGFGRGGCGACQYRSRGGFRVQRVALALPPASTAVGAVDFDDVVSVLPQVTDQTGAPAARPLDAERSDVTQLLGPRLKRDVAVGRGVAVDGAEPSPDLVQSDCDVNVAVGVDPDDDDGPGGCDRCCCHCYSSRWRWSSAGWSWRTELRRDLWPGSYQVTRLARRCDDSAPLRGRQFGN